MRDKWPEKDSNSAIGNCEVFGFQPDFVAFLPLWLGNLLAFAIDSCRGQRTSFY